MRCQTTAQHPGAVVSYIWLNCYLEQMKIIRNPRVFVELNKTNTHTSRAHLYLDHSNNFITCLEIGNTVVILLPGYQSFKTREHCDLLAGKVSLSPSLTQKNCNWCQVWWSTHL